MRVAVQHGIAAADCLGRFAPAAIAAEIPGRWTADVDPLLTEWLSDLKGSPVSLGNGRNEDAAANLWTLTIPAERRDIDEDQVLELLREVQRDRLSTASAGTDGAFVFYVWHDEAAGGLCMSLMRGRAADLPFGARVELVSDLRTIVQSYLACEVRDGIPWTQLTPVSFDVEEQGEYVLQVWAVESE